MNNVNLLKSLENTKIENKFTLIWKKTCSGYLLLLHSQLHLKYTFWEIPEALWNFSSNLQTHWYGIDQFVAEVAPVQRIQTVLEQTYKC